MTDQTGGGVPLTPRNGAVGACGRLKALLSKRVHRVANHGTAAPYRAVSTPPTL